MRTILNIIWFSLLVLSPVIYFNMKGNLSNSTLPCCEHTKTDDSMIWDYYGKMWCHETCPKLNKRYPPKARTLMGSWIYTNHGSYWNSMPQMQDARLKLIKGELGDWTPKNWGMETE